MCNASCPHGTNLKKKTIKKNNLLDRSSKEVGKRPHRKEESERTGKKKGKKEKRGENKTEK